MDFIQSAVLGLVQGLTEFIPVSSTGHLILVRKLMDLPLAGSLAFDAILQLATGLAVLVYFWKDIWNIIKNKEAKLFWTLVIGTIPAVILGLLLQKYMDTVFRGTSVVAFSLVAGAILFYFAEKISHQKIGQANGLADTCFLTREEIRGPESELFSGGVKVIQGFLIGLFQCLALVPGMSRSGSTIAGGLFAGLTREVAIRFSFLLSLPIIFGSGLKKVYDLAQAGALAQVESSLILASIFAFISGLLAIHFLIKFLKNHSLNYFGVYRILLATVILIWL